MTHLFGRAVVTAALALSVVGPGIAQASHSMAGVTIVVRRVNDVNVALYQGFATCTQTSCVVQVEMSKRDLGRMRSWCGDTTVTLVQDNQLGSNADVQICEGPSTWHLGIRVDTYFSPGSLATHDSPVTIQVQAVLPS